MRKTHTNLEIYAFPKFPGILTVISMKMLKLTPVLSPRKGNLGILHYLVMIIDTFCMSFRVNPLYRPEKVRFSVLFEVF